MSNIRKYINMIEAAGYSVQVPSLDGVMKRFASLTASGVDEWRNTIAIKAKIPKIATITDQVIYDKVIDAIGMSFPDGDPIDHFSSWLEKNNITMDKVDTVFKKYNRGCSGYYDYLASTWSDMQDDKMHDATNGHIDDYSQFYKVSSGGVITPKVNPWS